VDFFFFYPVVDQVVDDFCRHRLQGGQAAEHAQKFRCFPVPPEVEQGVGTSATPQEMGEEAVVSVGLVAGGEGEFPSHFSARAVGEVVVDKAEDGADFFDEGIDEKIRRPVDLDEVWAEIVEDGVEAGGAFLGEGADFLEFVEDIAGPGKAGGCVPAVD